MDAASIPCVSRYFRPMQTQGFLLTNILFHFSSNFSFIIAVASINELKVFTSAVKEKKIGGWRLTPKSLNSSQTDHAWVAPGSLWRVHESGKPLFPGLYFCFKHQHHRKRLKVTQWLDQGPRILQVLEGSKGEEKLPNTDRGACCLIIRRTSLAPAQELGAGRGKTIKLQQTHSFKKYPHVSWSEVWEHTSEWYRRGSSSHKAHASAVAPGEGQSLSQVPSQHCLKKFCVVTSEGKARMDPGMQWSQGTTKHPMTMQWIGLTPDSPVKLTIVLRLRNPFSGN